LAPPPLNTTPIFGLSKSACANKYVDGSNTKSKNIQLVVIRVIAIDFRLSNVNQNHDGLKNPILNFTFTKIFNHPNYARK
jgi:hypothetical protein